MDDEERKLEQVMRLTRVQRETLRLLCAGHSNVEIIKRIGREEATFYARLDSLSKALGLSHLPRAARRTALGTYATALSRLDVARPPEADALPSESAPSSDGTGINPLLVVGDPLAGTRSAHAPTAVDHLRWTPRHVIPLVAAVGLGITVVLLVSVLRSPDADATTSPGPRDAVFYDSLRKESLDPMRWEIVRTGVLVGDIQPQRDGVHFRLLADSALHFGDDFGLNLQMRQKLRGDFDVSVAYRFITWPDANGARLAIASPQIGNVQRSSLAPREHSGGERYATDFSFVGQAVAGLVWTGDRQGRLRLMKVGNRYTGFRWDGTDWGVINAFTGKTTGDDQLSLGLFSRAVSWGRKDVEVVVADFQVSRGTLIP